MASPVIVFAGTGEFAKIVLGTLIEKYPVALVITQNVTSKTGAHSPVFVFATDHQIPVLTPSSIHDIEAEIASLKPTVLIVADYGQIIRPAILALPSHGAINIHPSLLPLYRGPAPIQNALLSGDKETGVTIIQMDSKMDHGPILAQERLKIEADDTYLTLLHSLAERSGGLLLEALAQVFAGTARPIPQDDSRVTTHSFLKREDGELHPGDTVEKASRLWRALSPWPGVWFRVKLNGKEKRVRILELGSSQTKKDTSLSNLSLVYTSSAVHLSLFDGLIELKQLQVEGKKIMDGASFFLGYQNSILKGE